MAIERGHLRLVSDATTTGGTARASDISEVALGEPAPARETPRMTVEDLYPDASVRPAVMNTALKLLYEADNALDEAVTSLRAQEFLAADDATQRFFALLPELFCCRSLGDGFGIAVNAMFHSLQNLEGTAANEKQLLAFAYVCRYLRGNLFCSPDSAIEVVEKLVDTELAVDPPALDAIAEGLVG